MARKITTESAWREARIRAGLTRAELAKRADISVRTIERIEQGQITRPRMATVKPVAQVLGLSPLDLLPEEVDAA